MLTVVVPMVVQWVKNPAVAAWVSAEAWVQSPSWYSKGFGIAAAVAQVTEASIQPLAQEFPYATGAAIKKMLTVEMTIWSSSEFNVLIKEDFHCALGFQKGYRHSTILSEES